MSSKEDDISTAAVPLCQSDLISPSLAAGRGGGGATNQINRQLLAVGKSASAFLFSFSKTPYVGLYVSVLLPECAGVREEQNWLPFDHVGSLSDLAARTLPINTDLPAY